MALAISLAATPAGTGARSKLNAAVFKPAIALNLLAAYRRSRPVHWSDFRYNRQTWLEAVKAGRHVPGYGKYAARIFKTRSGRLYVPLASERRAILRLRRNVTAAFLLTGNRVAQSYAALARRLARRPHPAELFMAQRFGPGPAARLIVLARKHPRMAAAPRLPGLAFMHTGLFFGKRRARPAGEIYRIVRQAFARAARRAKSRAGWTAGERSIAQMPASGKQAAAAVARQLIVPNRRLDFTARKIIAALQWDKPASSTQ